MDAAFLVKPIGICSVGAVYIKSEPKMVVAKQIKRIINVTKHVLAVSLSAFIKK